MWSSTFEGRRNSPCSPSLSSKMSAPQQQTGAEQLDLATQVSLHCSFYRPSNVVANASPPPSAVFDFPQRELATFIEQEQTKAKLQATIHDMTSMCWDK